MEELSAGIIGAAHGLKGFCRFISFSGDVEYLKNAGELKLKRNGKSLLVNVEDLGFAGKYPLIKFKEINSLEDARGITNWGIWVKRKNANPKTAGEYYYADIYGLRVMYKEIEKGSITGIYDSNPADLLEVRTKEGKNFLIPCIDRFIGKIDVDGGTIELLEDKLLE